MTQPSHKRLAAHAAVWAGSLALAGCFGGNDDDNVATTPVVVPSPLVAIPATASASIQGLLVYQSSVLASPLALQDTAEPIDVSSLTLPVSETAEPTEV